MLPTSEPATCPGPGADAAVAAVGATSGGRVGSEPDLCNVKESGAPSALQSTTEWGAMSLPTRSTAKLIPLTHQIVIGFHKGHLR